MVAIIDVVFIVIIFGFALTGFLFGLIHMIGSLLGMIVGIAVATRVAGPVGEYLGSIIGLPEATIAVIAGVIIYLLTARIFGIIFSILEKTFDLISIVPFVKPIDRLLGAGFGFVEGVILLGAVLFLGVAYLPEAWTNQLLAPSQMSSWLLNIFDWLLALVPESVSGLFYNIEPAAGVELPNISDMPALGDFLDIEINEWLQDVDLNEITDAVTGEDSAILESLTE